MFKKYNFLSLFIIIFLPSLPPFVISENLPLSAETIDKITHNKSRVTSLGDKYANSRKYGGQMYISSKNVAKGNTSSAPKFVNVDDFGAKGDHGTDDSQAFNRAWKEACSSKVGAVFVVPRNKSYMLKQITFSGPCQSPLTFQIYGKINASTQRSDYTSDRRRWISFENIQNFVVDGGRTGIINGRGKTWWRNSCKIDKRKPCTHAPTALSFSDCKNLQVRNLRIQNAQQMHLTFQDSVNVEASFLTIKSPSNSPNTDGIHVTSSRNVRMRNSLVRTGDDCVSIVSGSKNIQVRDITCGPGHGISIGSLGKNNSHDEVSNVIVDRARISGTTNGLRIKSWQGGSGYARNILFKNIMMHNVTNPIIVDQNYCDQEGSCPEQYSAVQVENVVYKNIKGTSSSEMAIKLDCSKSFPCKGIVLQDVNLRYLQTTTTTSSNVEALCNNVILTTRGKVLPLCPS